MIALKKFIKNWRKFKVILIIISTTSVVVFAGVFTYFREYQNLPEFGMNLMAEIPLPQAAQKIIIFSPHSDDETLGAGGYIAQSVKNGADVKVVLITNGDGHRFSSIDEFKELYPDAGDYIQSGYARQQESIDALQVLGIKKENIIFLGYPDSGLKDMLGKNWSTAYTSKYTKRNSSPYLNSYHQNISYTGENLETDISKILSDYRPDIVFATTPADIHPDHSATGNFVKKALEKNNNLKPKLYFYLIHYKRFPYPKGYHTNRMITPPSKLIEIINPWLKLTLSDQTLELKKQAVKQYKTQLKVPLLRSLMDGFIRKNELFQEIQI